MLLKKNIAALEISNMHYKANKLLMTGIHSYMWFFLKLLPLNWKQTIV